jgi:hypothetical protein
VFMLASFMAINGTTRAAAQQFQKGLQNRPE